MPSSGCILRFTSPDCLLEERGLLAISCYLTEYVVGDRIRIQLSLRDCLESFCPTRITRERVEAGSEAVLDDRAHLTPRAVGAPLTPRSAALQEGAVLGDALDQLTHARAVGGNRAHDWRRPLGALFGELQHGAQFGGKAIGARQVGLVDHEDVGDLEDAGLDGLDVVAESGH